MTAISDEKGLVKFIGLQYGEDARDIESNKQSDETYKYDADKASTKYWVAEPPAGPPGLMLTISTHLVSLDPLTCNGNRSGHSQTPPCSPRPSPNSLR